MTVNGGSVNVFIGCCPSTRIFGSLLRAKGDLDSQVARL